MLFSWTRLIGALVAGACLASAQSLAEMMRMQRGYFHGEMVRWEGTASIGDLIAKDADGEFYACGYDSKTYIELARAKVAVTRLIPGDPLEILVDRQPGSRMCYVRIVHVVPPQRKRPSSEPVRRLPSRREPLTRGDRTISGVVVRIENGNFILRTREGDVALEIRRDSRFYADAQQVGPEALAVNTRVSVRAGPTLEGGMQAYQVHWGGIVTVR